MVALAQRALELVAEDRAGGRVAVDQHHGGAFAAGLAKGDLAVARFKGLLRDRHGLLRPECLVLVQMRSKAPRLLYLWREPSSRSGCVENSFSNKNNYA